MGTIKYQKRLQQISYISRKEIADLLPYYKVTARCSAFTFLVVGPIINVVKLHIYP
jgi:hypothetical protein